MNRVSLATPVRDPFYQISEGKIPSEVGSHLSAGPNGSIFTSYFYSRKYSYGRLNFHELLLALISFKFWLGSTGIEMWILNSPPIGSGGFFHQVGDRHMEA